jgi:diacylglycerol O-acyltransferase / wax synthase
MKLMSPMDSLFLIGESREHPLHVAGLQVFTPPQGTGPEFVRDTYEAMLACKNVQPTFRKRPATALGGFINVAWTLDEDIDLEYHVRRSALPTPGRVRELLELTSRLHGTLLDRHRPLWDSHVIESPKDGRFAVYTKVHHALVDGVSALKLMQRSLSTDPAESEIRVPWALPPRPRQHSEVHPIVAEKRMGTMQSVARKVPSTLALARAALKVRQLEPPYRAPRSMLNVPIGGARRCAAQSWSLKRIATVKDAAGATVNDVVLAMCAGALRCYLSDLNALPDMPLIAMVPVSVRAEHDPGGGNAVSTVLCDLATNLNDPAKRLEVIHTSMQDNKKVLSQLPKAQAMAVGMLTFTSMWLSGLPGFRAAPPPFNICISNVPGPQETLYWNGARLDGNYPLSVAMNGQALNITVATCADNLDFGLVGCRRSVPHLQRLLGHLEAALKDLEQAVGV